MTVSDHHTKDAVRLVNRDRRESLKAATLAGAVVASLELLGLLVAPALALESALDLQTVLLRLAIAGLTGGVFGIAYRYIRREDRNPHLDSGAVAAFTIARASGSVALLGEATAEPWARLGLAALAGGLGFWLASLVLNLAFRRQWVQCCPPRTQPHA